MLSLILPRYPSTQKYGIKKKIQVYLYKTPRKPKLTAKRKMILTTCAACAAPLAHTAPRCVRSSLGTNQHFKEARSVLRKMVPVARRVLGEGHMLTFKMRWTYAKAFYMDSAATLDDLGEVVAKLEDLALTARRVFGSAHPLTVDVESDLRKARAALRRAREPGTA